MKIKLDRIISVLTLVAAVTAIVLVLKKPAPVVQPQTPAAVAEHAQPSDQKTAELPAQSQQYQATSPQPSARYDTPSAVPTAPANPAPAASVNSEALSAMIAKTLGGGAGASSLSPDSSVGSGSPNIKDQQITMDGDIVHGKFLTEIGGKDVWVTISGHMGEKDGYATFDPTEFKVGNTEVPVSLVNPLLQRKLAEERDRLKIPTGGSQ
ncbi:MAG TPA: hypothetical protein VE377_09375 [Candidatus Dormibacteraeota bacterium]|nr:hypothetical protein [Candidatus Dormibacteraeota bacterium]